MLEGFKDRWLWFKAMGHYRKAKYDKFFSLLDEMERGTAINNYQLAVKANALLLCGKYKDSLDIFSVLSSSSNDELEDSNYIAMYSRAMIADINGDSREFERLARLAAAFPARRLVKRTLPLSSPPAN
jgi:hypothetical protein